MVQVDYLGMGHSQNQMVARCEVSRVHQFSPEPRRYSDTKVCGARRLVNRVSLRDCWLSWWADLIRTSIHHEYDSP